MEWTSVNKTIADVFNNMSDQQKDIAYEMIGKALEDGTYDIDALVMFNKEEQLVIKFLLREAMGGNNDANYIPVFGQQTTYLS